MTQKHAMGFSWSAINLTGYRTVPDVDLQIADVFYFAKGTNTSRNDLGIYRLHLADVLA